MRNGKNLVEKRWSKTDHLTVIVDTSEQPTDGGTEHAQREKEQTKACFFSFRYREVKKAIKKDSYSLDSLRPEADV